MRSKCLFIFVLITGMFFVMSALEINTDTIKNTFDDDYDHYIQPDVTPVHTAVAQFHNDDLPVLSTDWFDACFFGKGFVSSNCANSNNQFYPENFRNPPKIYLRYRLLRI